MTMLAPAHTRLRAAEAAVYLGISRSTLAKWRMRDQGPAFHRCGPRIVYYFKDEIDAWLDECDRRDKRSTAA
ncbi:helix-turn-helix domain-containing protein [Pseudolabrys sp. Root1462]|uniref:helix-turn-helix transcriptional regulator n=1 Tax=Pseudolabrys sp. Root1462 TaxID=1736466 RepID=UPI0009EA0494|nr:helix-turn-helix domain-containing protein [Pseudolabrys sp. Root1462]